MSKDLLCTMMHQLPMLCYSITYSNNLGNYEAIYHYCVTFLKNTYKFLRKLADSGK